jgi:hypothetical protein
MVGNVWGKKPNIIPDVPLTLEQQKEKEKQQLIEKIKAEKQQKANFIVQKVQSIVTGVSSKQAGISSNYVGDDQFTIKGTYTKEVFLLAKAAWLKIYEDNNTRISLNAHVLGPSEKHTGDREGTVQGNFIRKINTAGQGRFNVHVDIK